MSDRGDIERVLAATDIVRVVRERVDLKQKGREWLGLCPFHDDRSPSMHVSPAKQIFKCFACGAGGDALTFVQKYDGVEFPQALQHLAEVAGVELTARGKSRPDGPTRSEKASALDANAFAQDYFRRSLVDPRSGAQARAMIEQRGISPEMVETFGLGAAPSGWDGLVQAALKARRPVDAFAAAQLVRAREQGGGHYDVFRNRLMFPIHDQGGRVIAFGGRRLSEDDPAKYLNSPESPVFKKSGVLYGLWKASTGIRQHGFCIVTEGYTDTIACHQAGFTNTVATLGTAFTVEHAALLRRLCGRVVLLFDGDQAGLAAADRAVGVLLAEALDVQIAILGEQGNAKDPDELLKQEGGKERFSTMLSSAADLLEFRFERLRARLAGQGRTALIRGIEEEVRALGEQGLRDIDPARQDRLFGQLGVLSGLDQHRLRELAREVRWPRARGGEAPAAVHSATDATTEFSAAERLVGLVLHEPGAWGLLSEDDVTMLRDALAGGPTDVVAAAIDGLAAEGEPLTMAALRGVLEEDGLQRATALAVWAERQIGSEASPASPEPVPGGVGASIREAVAGLLRAVSGRQGGVSADPMERILARREQLARFQADPGRIARP